MRKVDKLLEREREEGSWCAVGIVYSEREEGSSHVGNGVRQGGRKVDSKMG